MSVPRRYAAAVRARFRRATALSDVSRVFQLVYGRAPSEPELRRIEEILGPDNRHDDFATFRTVVNSVDHQHHPTPFAIRFGADDIAYIEVGGLELAVDTADVSVAEPIIGGYYEPHLRPFITDFLRPGMTFVDIGANVGFYSILASRAVGPEGHVLSFEPNSENCRLVMLSARRNGLDNITMYPFALGDSNGHALFHTHLGSNGGLFNDEGDALLDSTAVVVPIARLDDVVTHEIDLIKIDVEGAEALVMRGATGLIEKYRPTVVSEFSLEMLRRVSGVDGLDYLHYWDELGYSLHLCDRESHQLVPIDNVGRFVAGYGDDTRPEDLIFLP